jgi:hypothetical protein
MRETISPKSGKGERYTKNVLSAVMASAIELLPLSYKTLTIVLGNLMYSLKVKRYNCMIN